KLAATQWRTRFGRPSQVPRLGDVDPTGRFCAFPEEWLKQRAAAKAPPPTMADLRRIFVVNAVPFIAFGFLDNFVMIVAVKILGIYIRLKITTMNLKPNFRNFCEKYSA
ncbi:PREDICTED: transmembrane protein 65, partial [Rhagoletis zephyria]|uniref:transmembrane protein 65 n=1 Tax=Rhagoletis zephyria TaxID=28612 RepID=UPI0008112CC7